MIFHAIKILLPFLLSIPVRVNRANTSSESKMVAASSSAIVGVIWSGCCACVSVSPLQILSEPQSVAEAGCCVWRVALGLRPQRVSVCACRYIKPHARSRGHSKPAEGNCTHKKVLLTGQRDQSTRIKQTKGSFDVDRSKKKKIWIQSNMVNFLPTLSHDHDR